jgi:hypothetical protein
MCSAGRYPSVVSFPCIMQDTGRRTNAAILHDSYKPPVTVAIIEEDHCVPFCGIRLTLDGCDEIVKRVNKFEVNVFCS